MAVIESTKVGVLYPENSSWVLDYYFDTLSNFGNDSLEILRECSSANCKSTTCTTKLNSWNRASGFSNIESVQVYGSILIPCIYPFSASGMLINDLATLQKRGIEIKLVVLDPLVIGELKNLFDIADTIQVLDQRDFNTVLTEGVELSKVELSSYPLLENCVRQKSANIKSGLVFDVALSHEFRQVLVSSLYESLEHTFKVCRVPSLSKNLKEGDFDASFEQTLSNRSLTNRVQLEKSTLDYKLFKNYFSNAAYSVIPGDNLDALCERRALVALSVSYDLPVVLESQRCPLSEYQGISYSVEGPSEKVKGYSLSKAHTWAMKTNGNLEGSSNSDQVVAMQGQEISKSSNAPLIVLSEYLPRVLFKMRENVFTQSGGDTVLLNRLLDGLRERGFDTVIDLDGSENIKDFDLVHLFNFALKDNTEGFARECIQANVPYIVTSLYEDWPKFFNLMMATFQCFDHYLKVGQPVGVWEKLEAEIHKVPPCDFWDNTFTATNARAILTTGAAESDAIHRDYPLAKNIISIPLGCEVSDNFDGGRLFKDRYGIEDFIFSVGRLETRKNQLMLLKALEDTDHTLVFATNNFTYQPDYAKLCTSFKRKGKTIFLERLEADELASAYQAAKVHALPSWFELPGLVSLEAGRYGTNVVASKNGTIEDYLGEFGFYCNPGSYQSIREAVVKAFNAPRNQLLQDRVSSFSWDKSLDAHANLYRQIIGNEQIAVPTMSQIVVPAMDQVTEEIYSGPQIVTSSQLLSMTPPTLVQAPVRDQLPVTPTQLSVTPQISQIEVNQEDIDLVLKAADGLMAQELYSQALNAYTEVLNSSPNSSRVHRSIGVANLQLNKLDEAKESFKRSLAIDQMDIKSLVGVGAVEWALGRKQEAYEIYKNAANLDSSNQTAVLYLVNSSYELNRLTELEGVLREYLKNDPENTNIQYCLAGCFFKQNKLSLAGGTVERILRIDENHADALELKGMIASKNEEIASSNGNSDITMKTSLAPANNVSDLSALKIKLEKMKSSRKFEELVADIDNYFGPKGEDFNDLLILKAEALGCMGKKDEALALFNIIETEGYKLGKVYCGLGAIRASMNEWKEAETLFVKSLEQDSTLDMPLCGLGMCAEAENNLEDAWNYFVEASKRNAENIQAITGVIRVGYKLQRLEDVELVLKEYLELKPVDLYMLYALAGCLYAQGRTDEAVKELRNILIFEPENDKATELLNEIESGKRYQGANV